MGRYLTYEQYRAWGGTMDEAAFDLAELRARARIDAMTRGRLASLADAAGSGDEAPEALPEQVRAAMFEIIAVDAVYGAAAQAGAPVVASFEADGYSESYGGAEARSAAVEAKLKRTVEALLDGVTDGAGTPLLYAGVPVAR